MSMVRQKDTKPELALRRALHRLGYRFRLHRRDLPGSPDIVFSNKCSITCVFCDFATLSDPACQ
jgi:DNA mismatch endonuclease (patch repair protein)